MMCLSMCREKIIMLNKGLFLACLVQLFLSTKAQTLEPFELAEVLNGTFSARSFNATWVTGDELVYKRSADSGYYKLNVTSQSSELLLPSDTLNQYVGPSLIWTQDFNFVLIRHNVKSIFRHSTTAQYAVYDLVNKVTVDLHNKEFLQTAFWLPTNGIIYIFENNIYYLSSPSASYRQITFDGVPGVIYNGITDWVYEEEVMYSGQAVWPSPSGSKIAFAVFDDTNVEEMTYLKYGKPGAVESQYPEVVKLRYPKVGTTNPKFSVKLLDLSTQSDPITLSVTQEPSENLVLTSVKWANENEVSAAIQNREQTSSTTMRCTVANAECKLETRFDMPKGWIDISEPWYNKDGTLVAYAMPQPVGNDSYRHLVLIDTTTFLENPLTTGPKSVQDIIAWDEDKNLVYYSAISHDAYSTRQVYSVNTGTKEDICLTCTMETPEGACRHASAELSNDNSKIAKICDGPGPTFVQIEDVSNSLNSFIWELNDEVRETLSKKQALKNRDLIIYLDNGYPAYVRLVLPQNLDEAGAKTYPMIVNVYAGPGTTQISDQYSVGYEHYVVSNLEYIYAYIDGRGSSTHGNNLMYEMWRRMGTVEIEDQISATKILTNMFSFIDKNNVAIWGWSYGGFAAAWALAKDSEHVFKCALSVAPVTNFAYYDSIYTERYNGLISDNEVGYNNTDLMRVAENFRGRTFFLIHGNADDNVHYQQAMHLARALELADIMFDQASYPDENHSLGGVRKHLYHGIDKFWKENFVIATKQS